MKAKLIKFFYPVALFWWKWWSKLYRVLHQSKAKYRRIPLDKYHTPISAWNRLKTLWYRRDKFKELWDVCSRPEYVQYSLEYAKTYGYQPNGGPMDCDEFSIWAVNVLDPIYFPKLMTVAYQSSKDGKIGGHVTCTFKDYETGLYGHVSNWGIHRGYSTRREAAQDISRRKNSKFIVCAFFDKELRKIS